MSARLRALPYAGFSPLRRGRIHLLCPACGRKQSNAPRATVPVEDPRTAVLAICLCDGACSNGTKDNETRFRDARGRELCGYCGRHDCDKVGGPRRCSERLVNRATRRAIAASVKAVKKALADRHER